MVNARASRRGLAAGLGPVTSVIMGVTIAIQVLYYLDVSLWARIGDALALGNAATSAGQWWRLFTVVLIHAGFTHLLFNMWALYVLGPQVEREVGPGPYLALYLSCAAAGSALAVVLGNPRDVTVGASGAIFGLFGVWLASAYRRRRTRAGRAMFNQFVVLLAINAAIPLFIPNVSWEGHLGGLVAGFGIGYLWSRLRGPNAAALRMASAAAVAVVSVAAVYLL